MKQADIVIGNEYLTEVSGAKVKVKVISRVEPGETGAYYKKRVSFRVVRSDNGKVLEKTRDPAALHDLPKPTTYSVRFYRDESTPRLEGALMYAATEDPKAARASFDEIKEYIKNSHSGFEGGIVRLLVNDGPGLRYPKDPKLANTEKCAGCGHRWDKAMLILTDAGEVCREGGQGGESPKSQCYAWAKAPKPVEVTRAAYEDALRNCIGWCPDCKDFEVDGVEPDAEHQKCDKCEGLKGMGAEWALTCGLITVS